MFIKIDDDEIDNIVSHEMAMQYLSIKADLKNAKRYPDEFHPGDIAMWETLLPAIETVGRYYSYDFDKMLKKVKKDK